MDDATRSLVRLSAALAVGERSAFQRALITAAASAEPQAVEEALLQSYLFLGYPAALRALGAWRALTGYPAPPASLDDAEWVIRGAATCETVYSGQYPRLRDNIAALHPDMERWMIVEGYGKVLSRPGLELAVRELCIVALLAPQDAAPQLYSHLRGALNAGADPRDVDGTVDAVLPFLSEPCRKQLRAQWEAVRERRVRTPSED